MHHIRKLSHKINWLQVSSYGELLCKDGSVSMHQKNLQNFVIEIYKVVSGLCPKIMNEVFQFQIQNHHNLRNSSII